MRQLLVLAVGAGALAALNPAPTRAQVLATTTFVSGNGFDTNPCTVAAPCRSFQHAHDQTAAGGQITMVDPAGYGRVTITKAISIVNDGGGEAGISDPGSGQDAISIEAGASDIVTLRGLTLNGVGTGNNGITVISGGTLNIQNCVIRDFAFDGVHHRTTGSTAVTISDTIVSNNGGSGVLINPAGGTVSAYLERVAAIRNGSAGFVLTESVSSRIQATIVGSVAIGTGPNAGGSDGFDITLGAPPDFVTLINSKAMNNVNGVVVDQGPVYLSRVTLSGNGTGFSIGIAGPLNTFGDNYITDTNNQGTLTPIAAQ